MRLIRKGTEPECLTEWRRRNPRRNYSDLDPHDLVDIRVRTEIKSNCLSEQYNLCAYCCDIIEPGNSHNEHVIPQSADVSLSMIFTNIVASCNRKGHCGHYKDNRQISLTPLMPECETEVRYNLNGSVWHTTPRAQELVSGVNLTNRGLTHKRRELINILIINKIDDELTLLDNELRDLFAEDLLVPRAGRLEAFAPVLVSILRILP